jgi:hypothetical protein
MNKKFSNRFLAVVLTLVMMFSLTPASALAAEEADAGSPAFSMDGEALGGTDGVGFGSNVAFADTGLLGSLVWDGTTETEPSQTDGVYQIGSDTELAWLATTVNTGTANVNAVLTADINLGGEAWTPIGTDANNRQYSGTFDGQGYTVSGLNASSNTDSGLFGSVKNATIRNLVLEGTVVGTGASGHAGGVAGKAQGACTLTNIVNKVNITAGSNQGGSIIGYPFTGVNITLTNCVNYGTVSRGGGLLGQPPTTDKTAVINLVNCANWSTTYSTGYPLAIKAQATLNITDCYYNAAAIVGTLGGTPKTAAQFASGEVAYLLGMGQTIGTDAGPMLPKADGSNRVYQWSNGTYHNEEEPTVTKVTAVVTMNTVTSTMTLTDNAGNAVEVGTPSAVSSGASEDAKNVYNLSLAPGEYTLTGYGADGTTVNGILGLTVTDAAAQEFQVWTVTAWASNAGWALGTDYTLALTEVADSSGTLRTATLGTSVEAGKVTFLLYDGDTYYLDKIPAAAHTDTHVTLHSTGTVNGVPVNKDPIPAVATLTVTVPSAEYRVEVGTLTKYYVYTPLASAGSTVAGDGTVSYRYSVGVGVNYYYRVSHEDGVTYVNWVTPTGSQEVKVIARDLYEDDDSIGPNTVIRDFSKNIHDVADIYLNINPKGYLKLNAGETFQIVANRQWQAIEDFHNSQTAQPDYHYTVYTAGSVGVGPNISFTKGGNVVSVDENGLLTANSAGTAIVTVTYDALVNDAAKGTGGGSGIGGGSPFFSAIWPENTGVFVVTVGAGASGIEPYPTINEGRNLTPHSVDGQIPKLSGDTLDGEMDILYYLDGTAGASYRFTAAGATDVCVYSPTLTDTEAAYGNVNIRTAKNADGSFTVSGLTEGTHILKIFKLSGPGAETCEYQILRVKKLSYTLTYADGSALNELPKPGDSLKITFKTVYHGANKLAGIYNMSAAIVYTGGDGTELKSAGNQYEFAATESAQTITFSIRANWEGETYRLTNGVVGVSGFGSPYGAHRTVTKSGVNANYTAVQRTGYLGSLPDIELTLKTNKLTGTLSVQDEGGSAVAGWTGSLTASDGSKITLDAQGGFQVIPGLYRYSVGAAGYRYTYGEITVSEDGRIYPVALQTAAAGVWDGQTKTAPTLTDGVYQISSGAELAWFSDKVKDGTTNINATLTGNVDLGDYPWTQPIGGLEPLSGKPGNRLFEYGGTFDGAGYTVSGLYINAPSLSRDQGLFGRVNGATIKNLTVEGAVFLGEGSGGNGGLAAYASAATIQNCTGRVHITQAISESTTIFEGNLGGIVGYLASGTVDGCVNEGTISAQGYAGGIAGNMMSGSTIKNCVNKGAVSVTDSFAGGIVGSNTGLEVTYCENRAAVSGSTAVGGIAGYLGPVSSAIPVTAYCYNDGTITGTANIGGIIGWISIPSYSGLSVPPHHLYNAGQIIAAQGTANKSFGGVVGYYQHYGTMVAENAKKLSLDETVVYLRGTAGRGVGETLSLGEHTVAVTMDTLKLKENELTIEKLDEINGLLIALNLLPDDLKPDAADVSKLQAWVGQLSAIPGKYTTVTVYDYAAATAGLKQASENGVVFSKRIRTKADALTSDVVKTAFASQNLPYTMNEEGEKSVTAINGLNTTSNTGWFVNVVHWESGGTDYFIPDGLNSIVLENEDTIEFHYSANRQQDDIGIGDAGLPILTSLTVQLDVNDLYFAKPVTLNMGKYLQSNGETSYYLVKGSGFKQELAGSGTQSDPFMLEVEQGELTPAPSFAYSKYRLGGTVTGSLDSHYMTVKDLALIDSSVRNIVDKGGTRDFSISSISGKQTTYYRIRLIDPVEEPDPTPTPPEPDGSIKVKFRLIGSTLSKGNIDFTKDGKNQYRGAVYQTWIKTTSYTMNKDDTQYDLFVRAMDDAGLSYIGAERNYVSTIYAPESYGGYKLSEFTNGRRSGWMYTVNGKHPSYGLKDLLLKNGSQVVWHYVNDYSYEVEDWFDEPGYPALGDATTWNHWLDAEDTNPPTTSISGGINSGSGNAVTLTPKVTASNGVASATIKASDITNAITDAKKNDSKAIVIAPEITGTAKKVTVELPKASLSSVASGTDADLTVKTPVGNVTLPNSVLASVASQASGSNVTISLESVNKETALTAAQKEAVGDDPVYDVSILSGGKNISSFDGGRITVSLPYTLKDGEDPSGVTVWYLNDAGELEKMTCTYDKSTGLATFTTNHLSYYVVGWSEAWQNPFSDVKDTDWFYGAVEFAVRNGLFNGTTATAFSPNSQMTRAMLVTVLYRADQSAKAATGGAVTASGSAITGSAVTTAEPRANTFSDVKAGQWYTDAVAWANANGIVTGMGGGLFGTDNNVTREQMATILYNYANYRGYDIAITATAGIESFADAPAVSGWAQTPMKWANGEKLITGRTADTLAPGGGATRAEVATILQRFAQGVAK